MSDVLLWLPHRDAPVDATKFAKLPPKGYYDKIGTTSKAISVNGKGITMVSDRAGFRVHKQTSHSQSQPDMPGSGMDS